MKTECYDCSCREWCSEKLKANCPDHAKPVIPVNEIEPEFIIVDGVRITPDDLAPNDPEFERSIMELLDY